MQDRKKLNARLIFLFVLALAGTSIGVQLTGCSSPKPVEQAPSKGRYPLNGRVVSVDKTKQEVVVDAAEIPGYMMAMTMGYAVQNPNLLEPLSPEDQITADVVVNGNQVWLENIVVVKKPDQAKPPAPGEGKPAPQPPAKH